MSKKTQVTTSVSALKKEAEWLAKAVAEVESVTVRLRAEKVHVEPMLNLGGKFLDELEDLVQNAGHSAESELRRHENRRREILKKSQRRPLKRYERGQLEGLLA